MTAELRSAPAQTEVGKREEWPILVFPIPHVIIPLNNPQDSTLAKDSQRVVSSFLMPRQVKEQTGEAE